MSFTDYLEDEILDHILGGADFPRPATVYIGLSTTTPNDDGTNFTEPGGGSYARVAVTNNATEWPASTSGTKTHANDILFPTATGSWGTVTHFGIFDQVSGGNLLMAESLTVPKSISSADEPRFVAGEIEVQLF